MARPPPNTFAMSPPAATGAGIFGSGADLASTGMSQTSIPVNSDDSDVSDEELTVIPEERAASVAWRKVGEQMASSMGKAVASLDAFYAKVDRVFDACDLICLSKKKERLMKIKRDI